MDFVRKMKWVVGLITILLVAACGSEELPTAVPTLSVPTSLPATEAAPEEPTAVPTSTSGAAEPEQLPTTSTATAVPPTNTPEPTPIPPTPTATVTISSGSAGNFAVIYVEPNDVLNVRSGPGVAFGVVGSIPPTATDVQITGSGQVVSGSTWVPVRHGGLAGWVNSRFLTGNLSDATFCGNTAVLQLLNQLETAVANQDDALLAQLIHPERGLRVRLLWYEAETRLDNLNLLGDPTSYNWGNAAGSGEPILGTPTQVLLPRLQNDFLGATEIACNDILHGGTPGFVVLPESYEPLNYYSYYRPGTEEYAELDWGSWVIGVELWQGSYVVSTLIHYQWEP
ncbi:SH3 domain-containing protein [Candidatus Leptofilum sp.]|uniref:SH3 domain-containing protein n=1 Tax=Candidatus Leptofilum sp. TaxID=3241576 RepID=UPI003B5AC175